MSIEPSETLLHPAQSLGATRFWAIAEFRREFAVRLSGLPAPVQARRIAFEHEVAKSGLPDINGVDTWLLRLRTDANFRDVVSAAAGYSYVLAGVRDAASAVERAKLRQSHGNAAAEFVLANCGILNADQTPPAEAHSIGQAGVELCLLADPRIGAWIHHFQPRATLIPPIRRSRIIDLVRRAAMSIHVAT